MPYFAYAKHRSQANIYQDFYNSMPRKTPPLLLVLNFAFLLHLTSNSTSSKAKVPLVHLQFIAVIITQNRSY